VIETLEKLACKVSIPSNGSIQFLHTDVPDNPYAYADQGLNPLKRVNSILTEFGAMTNGGIWFCWSQSPQTGQFNSYGVQTIMMRE